MPVYYMVTETVTDPSWTKDYTAAVPALVAKHGGRYLARGLNPERTEGEGASPNVAVVLEFPSEDALRAWKADPEYKPHLDARLAGSKSDAFIVPGA